MSTAARRDLLNWNPWCSQEVYAQLKAREERVRRVEAQQAEDEAEALRRLRAREEGIEAALAAREARLAQQVALLKFLTHFSPGPVPATAAVLARMLLVWHALRDSARCCCV